MTNCFQPWNAGMSTPARELNDIKEATYHYDELLSALERRDVDASQKAIEKSIDEANTLLQRQYFN